MKPQYKKNIRLVAILGLCVSMLAGCASIDDIRSNTDNLDTTINELVDRNVSLITELYNHGILDANQKKSWEDSIRNKTSALIKSSGESSDQFKNAIVSIASSPSGKANTPKYDTIASSKIKGKEESASPIMLFDESSVTTFLSDLNRPVYVLNSTRVVNGVSTSPDFRYLQVSLALLKGDAESLDRVIKAEGLKDTDSIAGIGSIKDLKSNITNLSDDQVSKLEAYVMSYFKKTDSNLASLDSNDIFVTSTSPGDVIGTSSTNEMNKDLMISSDSLVAITVRVKELNKNLLKLIDGVGSGTGNGLSGEYYICKNTKVALKLDYPLEVISNVYTGSISNHGNVSDKTWEVETQPVDYTMSLYSGKMYSNDYKSENSMVDSIYVSKSVMPHSSHVVSTKVGYIQKFTTETGGSGTKINSDDIDFDAGSTEEIINDTTYTKYKTKSGGIAYANYVYMKCPTLVLRDYLEYTYFPSVVGSESFIATGRRLRVNKLVGSGSEDDIDKFAEIITSSGGSYEKPMYTSLRNIIDYTSNVGYYSNVAEKLGLGTDNSETIRKELAKPESERKSELKSLMGTALLDEDGGEETSTDDKGSITSSSLVHSAYFNWIRPVEVFGTSMGKGTEYQDINSNDSLSVANGTVPKMWGIFTSSSINDSLLSTWINVDSSMETGSLSWWNGWLIDNKFTYKITKDMLENGSSLGNGTVNKKSGDIIFDLDVVAKAQKLENDKSNKSWKIKVSTISRMSGMVIVLYGLVLLGAWVVDVNLNLDTDKKLFTILSFNKWIAITDRAGLEDISTDRRKYKRYVDFNVLVIDVFIICCIGVTLIYIDVFTVYDLIYKPLEGLVEKFGKMLFG